LSEDDADAAAGAAAGVAGAAAGALSFVGFESALGFESLPALPAPSPEDLGLALP
jgi:hypothetical protein